MKSVLISIKPKWCKLIANGKKTVEIRKTKPKLETPFKCYIYCTKNTRKYALHTYINSGYGRKHFGVIGQWRSGKEIVDVNPPCIQIQYLAYLAEGKVIGEFVCDSIISHCEMGNADIAEQQGRIRREELFEYANGKELFGWHISDLVIYDKPREINEFVSTSIVNTNCFGQHLHKLDKPPRSWCYAKYERSGE